MKDDHIAENFWLLTSPRKNVYIFTFFSCLPLHLFFTFPKIRNYFIQVYNLQMMNKISQHFEKSFDPDAASRIRIWRKSVNRMPCIVRIKCEYSLLTRWAYIIQLLLIFILLFSKNLIQFREVDEIALHWACKLFRMYWLELQVLRKKHIWDYEPFESPLNKSER